MLRAHANAPGRTMTAGELARSADYGSFESANSNYGKLGHKIVEFLDLAPPPIDKRRGEPVWTRALADDGESDPQGHWRWVMHPEVAEALRELNMA